MTKSFVIILGLLLTSFSVYPETFTFPPIPKYDSVYIDEYEGFILEKSYFLNGMKVFEIGYNTGSMFYTPFFHVGGGEEDSCYAYFNGEKHDTYDFYYMSKTHIKNEQYSETSKIFKYQKFDWNKNLIEKGDSYFMKEMYERTISFYKKYKIGEWITYDSLGKPAVIINYDNCTVNGESIKYEGNMKIIDSLKTLVDNKIISVYGKDFFSKYVRLNLDRSGYWDVDYTNAEQPGGNSFFYAPENKILSVDFSYDIVLENERFNILQFRITNEGQFIGRKYSDIYLQDYYFTIGLDSLNTHQFHKSVLNWKTIAIEKGLDYTGKNFNIRMEYSPVSDYFGELRLILEQATESTSTEYSFTNKLIRYTINPWNGEIVETSDESGIESIMIDVEAE